MRIIPRLLYLGFASLVTAVLLFAADLIYVNVDKAADKLGAPRLVPRDLLAFAGLAPAILFAIGVIAVFMHSRSR